METIPKSASKNKSEKRAPDDGPSVHEMVESIIGCKWSLHVLSQVRRGVNRPGAMVRTTDGLTTKVLNERLAKMVRFDILEKVSYPEVPPRVEYGFTDFGVHFLKLVDEVDALQQKLAGMQSANRKVSRRHS